MCVCVCVCIYIYIYIYVCVYICTSRVIDEWTCIYSTHQRLMYFDVISFHVSLQRINHTVDG